MIKLNELKKGVEPLVEANRGNIPYMRYYALVVHHLSSIVRTDNAPSWVLQSIEGAIYNTNKHPWEEQVVSLYKKKVEGFMETEIAEAIYNIICLSIIDGVDLSDFDYETSDHYDYDECDKDEAMLFMVREAMRGDIENDRKIGENQLYSALNEILAFCKFNGILINRWLRIVIAVHGFELNIKKKNNKIGNNYEPKGGDRSTGW